MKRTLAVFGTVASAAAGLSALRLHRSEPVPVAVVAEPAMPALSCTFYDFVGRALSVGAAFAVARAGDAPAFIESSQIEADRTRVALGDDGTAPPRWTFEAGSPPDRVSPGDAIRVVLYGYRGTESTGIWFEAGLRSIRYLNLDGKCRRYGT